jgi:hypothetical protein
MGFNSGFKGLIVFLHITYMTNVTVHFHCFPDVETS